METLRKSREFKRVMEGGNREKLETMVVYALPNPEGRTRVGISVTRRAGGSVKRNRIKRRIREAVKRNASLLPQGMDIVIVAGKSCYDAKFVRIEEDIKMLGEKWTKR